MKHRIAGVFLAICCMITLLLVSANANTGKGILNNGLDGISINIYSSHILIIQKFQTGDSIHVVTEDD